MKYNDLTIQKLRELSILEVADKLGFQLKGLDDEGRRALCPYHDDKHPSLHFSKKKSIFKCFVCGAKGDLFKLVMDDRNCTFPEACEWLVKEFNIVVVPDAPIKSNTNRRQTEWHQASLNARGAKEEDKVNLTNPTNKKFSNWLSPSGRRAEPSPILDSEINNSSDSSNSCSGKTSVSSVKSVFDKEGVCIVESEKSAVILSEMFPDFIWLSCGGLQSFKPQLLAPLVNYKVIVFPDTDPTGDAFRQWSQVATEAQRLYKFRYPLRVSPLLESHATSDQKQRKIDLVDYLYEACDSARTVSCSHEHCRAQADSTEGQHGSLGSNG